MPPKAEEGLDSWSLFQVSLFLLTSMNSLAKHPSPPVLVFSYCHWHYYISLKGKGLCKYASTQQITHTGSSKKSYHAVTFALVLFLTTYGAFGLQTHAQKLRKAAIRTALCNLHPLLCALALLIWSVLKISHSMLLRWAFSRNELGRAARECLCYP